MNLMNRTMSYDKNKKVIQESCECKECTNKNLNVLPNNFPKFDWNSLTENEIQTIINLKYWWKDDKTKTFIWKALHVHGSKYDYSNVVYIKSSICVKIICRIKGHKLFSQTPNNHLNGQGCRLCGYEKVANKQRVTLEKFIKRAKEIHGDKYDYSKVNYVDMNTKVTIICPKHGTFPIKPANHLIGRGCKFCGIERQTDKRRITLEEFIERARKIHGNKYDYSKVKYVNYDTKVIIICPKHDAFSMTPNNHITGQQGCSKCKNNYKGEIFIRNFLTNHNIEFEEQKKFEECKDIRCLPFDFYLPLYNLCIEYDGTQHFKPIKRSNKMTNEEIEKNLKITQNHDRIKNEYCKNKGINLLRIKYNENAENKLTKYFSENNII